jgi:hypothetical protein
MWFIFRALPEKGTTSPPFCERSYERFQRHHALGVSKKDDKMSFG